jgi:hypothetical protein
MTQQDYTHFIAPPPELVQKWLELSPALAIAAAFQAGADQELKACCHYFARDLRESLALELRAARRPKPPSLKEQALDILRDLSNGIETAYSWNVIQSALEQLDD